MIPIPGVYNMIPVIHECDKCPYKEECETPQLKDQGYCYTYKDKE
jgi:hypothetical protein